VLIFFTAGLLSPVLRARRLLGAYRIPWRPTFSSHLINVSALSEARFQEKNEREQGAPARVR
jgi:hypothetical protein